MNYFRRHSLLLRAMYAHMPYVHNVKCVMCGEEHLNFTFDKNPICFFCGVKTEKYFTKRQQTSLFGGI